MNVKKDLWEDSEEDESSDEDKNSNEKKRTKNITSKTKEHQRNSDDLMNFAFQSLATTVQSSKKLKKTQNF